MRVSIFLFIFSMGLCFDASESAADSDKVTLVDIGSKNCAPCRIMAPQLKELDRYYENKAVIKVIDIIKNPEARAKYGTIIMPTQIFYDKTGKERYRHEGYMGKREMQEVIDRLLVE